MGRAAHGSVPPSAGPLPPPLAPCLCCPAAAAAAHRPPHLPSTRPEQAVPAAHLCATGVPLPGGIRHRDRRAAGHHGSQPGPPAGEPSLACACSLKLLPGSLFAGQLATRLPLLLLLLRGCSSLAHACLATQALLPPPFPTNAKLQLYASNVAVREDARCVRVPAFRLERLLGAAGRCRICWSQSAACRNGFEAILAQGTCRRQGIATALLAASELLAARWGYDSVWLHVEAANEAGVALYRGRGYSVVRRDPEWVPGSAFLMTKVGG